MTKKPPSRRESASAVVSETPSPHPPRLSRAPRRFLSCADILRAFISGISPALTRASYTDARTREERMEELDFVAEDFLASPRDHSHLPRRKTRLPRPRRRRNPSRRRLARIFPPTTPRRFFPPATPRRFFPGRRAWSRGTRATRVPSRPDPARRTRRASSPRRSPSTSATRDWRANATGARRARRRPATWRPPTEPSRARWACAVASPCSRRTRGARRRARRRDPLATRHDSFSQSSRRRRRCAPSRNWVCCRACITAW